MGRLDAPGILGGPPDHRVRPVAARAAGRCPGRAADAVERVLRHLPRDRAGHRRGFPSAGPRPPAGGPGRRGARGGRRPRSAAVRRVRAALPPDEEHRGRPARRRDPEIQRARLRLPQGNAREQAVWRGRDRPGSQRETAVSRARGDRAGSCRTPGPAACQGGSRLPGRAPRRRRVVPGVPRLQLSLSLRALVDIRRAPRSRSLRHRRADVPRPFWQPMGMPPSRPPSRDWRGVCSRRWFRARSCWSIAWSRWRSCPTTTRRHQSMR